MGFTGVKWGPEISGVEFHPTFLTGFLVPQLRAKVPENRLKPKRKVISQPLIFRGELLNFKGAHPDLFKGYYCRVSMKVIITIVSKLGYFTYLGNVSNLLM